MKAQRFAKGSEDRRRARSVLAIVREHRGRAAAIDMHAIASRTGITTREIQTIVKTLVEEHHLPIGTATSRPFGYFWIATNEERKKVRAHFVRRALSTLNHAKAFDSEHIVADLIGQLKLRFAEDLQEGQ